MTKISELKDFMINALVRRLKESNRANIERYVNRKTPAILKDLIPVALNNVRHTRYADDETVKLFLSTEYRKSWGQMTINSIQVDSPGLLAPILFDVIHKGHTNVASAIRIKERTLDALMEYAIEENDDLHWIQTFDFTDKDVFETPVNVASLRKYVDKLEAIAGMETIKRLRNLSIAKSILASLTTIAGPVLHRIQQPDVQVLIQELTLANSGRCYLKGLNLQNCPKDVRHAALGHCHLYDMRAGVFGVMAGIAKAYAEEGTGKAVEFHHIKDYVLRRNEIRMRITGKLWPLEAELLKTLRDYKSFHGFYKVKIALTAIGFGAKRNATSSWKNPNGNWEATSLRTAFKSKELVEQFVRLKEVKDLMDEFKTVTNIILLKLKTDSTFASSFDIDGLTSSQQLAMVYQGTESMIMGSFISLIPYSELLLPVHDGVYVSKAIDLQSLHYKLEVPFDIDKSYIQFEHSQIGLAMPVHHETEHQRAIAAEELVAQGCVPVHSTVSATPFVAPKRQVVTPWGLVDAELMPKEVKVPKRQDFDYD